MYNEWFSMFGPMACGRTMSQTLISELGNQELARVSNAGAYSVGAYSVGAYTEPATDLGAGKSDTS